MARNLLMACEDLEITPRLVLHDRDALLAHDFDRTLTVADVEVVKTSFRAPDGNAHAERWVRSVTEECLDHLILFGMSSLQRALRVYRDFYNNHRPHQGIGNRIPDRRATEGTRQDYADSIPEGYLAVEREQFLGGLLNSYYRKAAQSALEVLVPRERRGTLRLRRSRSRVQEFCPGILTAFRGVSSPLDMDTPPCPHPPRLLRPGFALRSEHPDRIIG